MSNNLRRQGERYFGGINRKSTGVEEGTAREGMALLLWDRLLESIT